MNVKQERRKVDIEEIKSISDWVVAWLFGIGAPLMILAFVSAVVMAAIGFIRWTLSWGVIGG